MKFQCDRCKTRYSIADERVRGKVLKIRCKNCAGVITVRESGASSAAGGSASPAPAASASASRARASAPLGAAFERAMARSEPIDEPTALAPPPTSDDATEWYLSSGANQEGPFSLKEARRRAATAKPSDELFGWKEGMADWLPVAQIPDLSPPRRPAAPPPLPPPRPSAPPIPSAALSSGGSGPSSRAAAPQAASKQPSLGLAALASQASAPSKPAARPVIAPASTAGDGTNPTISLAELAKNSAGLGRASPDPVRSSAQLAPVGNGHASASASVEHADDDPSLDFKISEASQVIDMSKLREVLDRPNAGMAAAARRTVAMAAATRGTGPTGETAVGVVVPAPVAKPARRPRAMILIAGGVAILVAVVGGLVFTTMMNARDGSWGGREGGTRNVLGDYYGDRGPNVITRTVQAPSDPAVKTPTRPSTGGSTGARPATNSGGAAGTPGSSGGKVDSFSGAEALTELTPQDVLDKMAQAKPAVKQCFNYALKTDPMLRISRLDVRLAVAPDGGVSEVKYLSGADKSQTLNQCLITLLKRWRFRPSRDGLTTDIPIMFSSG